MNFTFCVSQGNSCLEIARPQLTWSKNIATKRKQNPYISPLFIKLDLQLNVGVACMLSRRNPGRDYMYNTNVNYSRGYPTVADLHRYAYFGSVAIINTTYMYTAAKRQANNLSAMPPPLITVIK